MKDSLLVKYHAVERYRERVKPMANDEESHKEIVKLWEAAPSLVPKDKWWEDWADKGSEYVELCPGVYGALEYEKKYERYVLHTIITNSGMSEARRDTRKQIRRGNTYHAKIRKRKERKVYKR